MSSELQQIISQAQEGFRADPASAKATFATQSSLREGFHSEVSIRDHQLSVDEPESLGGADNGPNPVELVLAALGTCQEITYRAYAAALGIPLEHVSVELEGDIDLRGFFAVDESVRAGYEAIRGKVNLVSSATPEQIETLRGAVNAHCPVLDIITQPVPVKLEVQQLPPGGQAAAE